MPQKIDGRVVDGRYKKGIDSGSMSFLSIPLPLKKQFKPTSLKEESLPKQVQRQLDAKYANYGKKR